jgi:hypothetical protein
MKRYLLWSLMIGALALPPAARAATISLQGPAGPVTVGNSFWLDVNAATGEGENIWAYQFSLQFDPAILQFLDAQDGTFLPVADLAFATLVWDPYTPGDGSVNDLSNSLSGDAPGATGTGLLARIQFLTLAPSPGSFVSPFDTILLDFDLNQLGGVIETGTQVTVTAPEGGAVPEPGTCALLGLGLAVAVLRRVSASPH